MIIDTDIVIAGCGVSGLFCALHLPDTLRIVMVAKKDIQRSDSFLAQGGICVLPEEGDYDAYYNDTMEAGHNENNPQAVEIMIKTSPEIIHELREYGAEFAEKDGNLLFTKEGGHSRSRIVFHKDITGREITSKLLNSVKKKKNITIIENFTVYDIIEKDNNCYGLIGQNEDGEFVKVSARCTVLATGGVGGLYKHSTNYRHLTGDSLAIALRHNIKTENLDYVQIHPTTLYSRQTGRRFLISESVRGEGAILLDKNGNRFVDELLPRDLLSKKIFEQMEKDNMPYVRLSLELIKSHDIIQRFPNIYERCLEEGYDITKEPVPVVPAQHYFMGGIKVNLQSKTSMNQLYAVGETACNGVHGANRLASNSLLESLVFAKRAAIDINSTFNELQIDESIVKSADLSRYKDIDLYKTENKEMVKKEMKEEHLL